MGQKLHFQYFKNPTIFR